jgi:hypothetical protein
VSKTTVNINGEEYIIGEKYWFWNSDASTAVERVLCGIQYMNVSRTIFLVADDWAKNFISKTKPIDELSELKQAIKALDRLEDIKVYKKKIRNLVNKESLVIPHNEIGRTTVTLENTFIIETTPNFHGNLPKDK